MKEWLMEFAKTPVGTAVCLIVGIIVLVVMIFAKTSFGKKAIRDLTAKVLQNKAVVDEAHKVCKETKDNCDTKVKEVTDKCENAVNEEHNRIDELEEFVIKALKRINNVNVRKDIENYENKVVDKIDTESEKNADNGEKV